LTVDLIRQRRRKCATAPTKAVAERDQVEAGYRDCRLRHRSRRRQTDWLVARCLPGDVHRPNCWPADQLIRPFQISEVPRHSVEDAEVVESE
jgi:hypothetical protein